MESQVKDILALPEGESIKKKELTNEDATKLLSLAKVDVQESDIVYLLDTIDSIANAGPTNRAALSAGLSTHSLLSLLSHPSPSVISQALKTIGTIAFDIQAKKILVEQGIVNLSLDLAKSKESAVSFRATELIGHVCFGSEGTCESYLSSPSSLSSLLSIASESSNLDTKYSAIRAIGSMSEKTANQNKVAHQGGLEFLITELNKATERKEKDETLLYELIRSLSMLVQLNPPHVKQVATKGLKALVNTVNHFYRISSSQNLSISLSENSNRPEFTKSPDLVASDLLVVLADDETLRPAFMENGIFLELLNLLELPIGNVRVTRNILKIFARVSVNDGCMQKLMGHTTTVLNMLKQDDVEVQLAAILVIGNLARSEENVTKLIQTGVVDTLLNFIKENSATNTPLTHVCANVLRNFSISAQNKKRLGETQVIPTLIDLLAHTNPLVQFAAVVALKNLLLNCAPNLDVLLKQNGLPALIKLANDRGVLSENEDDTEEEKIQNADKRIQYECTRILVKLTERDDLMKEIVKEKGIIAILVMMGCEHDVLRLEASKSLSLISSTDEYRPAIIEASGGAEGLVKIFSQHDDIVKAIQANEDFQWNVAQIFKNLARNDQSRTALLAANIVPVLKTISKSASSKCKPVFIEALSTLTC